MCTISGAISLNLKKSNKLNSGDIKYITKIAKKGEARGKDGIGVYSNVSGILTYKPFIYFEENKFISKEIKIEENSPFFESLISQIAQNEKEYLKYSINKFTYDSFIAKTLLKKEKEGKNIEGLIKQVEDKGTFKNLNVLFSHNRAIPESEEQTDHTQPLENDDFVIIHNGIIANDKEILGKNYKGIDSNAILKLLDEAYYFWMEDTQGLTEPTLEDLFLFVKKRIKGSFAIAIYKKNTDEVLLATNFQPLNYKIKNNKLYFSSLKEYLEINKHNFLENNLIQELDSYSYIYINQKNNEIRKRSFKEKIKENKGLVLASGGLDTCVVAGIMKEDYQCKDLTFLHFDYGHKVEKQEQIALENIIKAYGAKYISIKLDFLKELFKDSPLLNGNIDTSGKGMELNLEYVPVRNLLFLSLATSYAEVHGFNLIGFGGNLSESMAYPDTTANFISKLNKVLPNAIGVDKDIKIIDPLKDLLKHEIIKEGLRVKAPMNLSWSCYKDTKNGKHCGVCASCRLREIGMNRNGLDIEGENIKI